jgi:ribosomal protein S18 acetylase RimI-like enzyme
MTQVQPHPLDNPVRSSLTGPHAHLAQSHGAVLRYPADVSPFAGMPDNPSPGDWDDLAALAGPGAFVALEGLRVPPPAGWEFTVIGDGVQMVHDEVRPVDPPDAGGEIVRLGAADVPEMLELTGRTRPGPFLPRTIELGTYLGIRHQDMLVAMAGERLNPPGWTEISAVCTDDRWRGYGLASRLVRVLVAGIHARGQTPFLQALGSNVTAVRLYEQLGFRVRRTTTFNRVRVPGAAS